jgi:hypothetical protein
VTHAVMRADKYTGEEAITLRREVPRPMGIVAVAADADDCKIDLHKNPHREVTTKTKIFILQALLLRVRAGN